MNSNLTLVEEELTEEIIYSIGVYVQLCARIEKLAIESVLIAEGVEDEKASQRKSDLSLLPISELVVSLKSVTDNLPSNHRWYEFF